ncbi:hypothetical protein COOONC_17562, partial [Cooperia oncophora]
MISSTCQAKNLSSVQRRMLWCTSPEKTKVPLAITNDVAKLRKRTTFACFFPATALQTAKFMGKHQYMLGDYESSSFAQRCFNRFPMARGGSQRKSSDQERELPQWATMMMDLYASCADRLEKALTTSLAKLADRIDEMNTRQNEILSRLAALEDSISGLQVSCSLDQKLLYSTIVKVKADGEKIDDKLKRITWIGIGEQGDETATRRFDMEALRE